MTKKALKSSRARMTGRRRRRIKNTRKKLVREAELKRMLKAVAERQGTALRKAARRPGLVGRIRSAFGRRTARAS